MKVVTTPEVQMDIKQHYLLELHKHARETLAERGKISIEDWLHRQ
jgi:hypothetical protein